MKFGVLAIAVLLMTVSAHGGQARILQILHTNDLHSYWDHSLEPDRGGYSRIKALMDTLEAEGNAKGWVTIRLDAGDFSDGNINYLSRQGYFSFRLMKLMGYDVVALGNHDYVSGLAPLVWFAGQEDTRLPLVAANFDSTAATNVVPGRMIIRGGIRIAVVGATTDSDLYRWMAAPAQILPPTPLVDDWLGETTADIRIALTHLGLYDDIQMVEESHNIDLVVGGHSHHTLHKPRYELNFDKHIVPVLQAGYHGHYVGQAVIQLPVWGTTHIIHYNLYPITSDMPRDPAVEAMVREGLKERQEAFRSLAKTSPEPQLDEPVAEADDTLYTYRYQNSVLGNFIADAIRDAAGTDVAFDIGALYGIGLAKGELTVQDILNLQPHSFDLQGPGWKIFKLDVSGSRLKKIMSLLSLSGYSFLTSGLRARLNHLHQVVSMTVDGIPVDDDKVYSVATSECAVKAAGHIILLNHFIKPPFSDTGLVLRDVLLKKARELKFFHASSAEEPRITWPGSDKIIGGATCGECVSQ